MPDILPIPKPTIKSYSPRSSTIYHRTLKETTEGLDYLRSRGVTVGEAIDHFRIGYANRTLGLTLPTMDSKAGREIRGRFSKLGLYRSSGHEHLNGCVVFPITAADGSGQVVDIYGTEDERRSSQGHAASHAPIESSRACGTSRRSMPAAKSFSARRSVGCPDVLECRLSQRDLHVRATSPTIILRRSVSSASGGCW